MVKHNSIIVLSKSFTGSEPVTLTEVKNHLLISHSADDTLLGFLIEACREEIEGKLNKSLVAHTIIAEIKSMGSLELLYPPVASVTTLVDAEGTTITHEIRESVITTEIEYGKITYTTTANVTASDKLQLLELIAYKYAHRGDEKKTNINTRWFL